MHKCYADGVRWHMRWILNMQIFQFLLTDVSTKLINLQTRRRPPGWFMAVLSGGKHATQFSSSWSVFICCLRAHEQGLSQWANGRRCYIYIYNICQVHMTWVWTFFNNYIYIYIRSSFIGLHLAKLAQSHYRNQCLPIINFTIRSMFWWNFNWNAETLFKKYIWKCCQ